MVSLRARVAIGAALSLAAAGGILVAWGSLATFGSRSNYLQGTALSAYGPQAAGTIGYTHVAPGKTYRFSFPVPQNKLDRPIELTGARVEQIPAGASLVDYELYSLKDVGDYPLTYDVTNSANTDDLLHKKNYIHDRAIIPAHSDSEYWAMVAIKVTGTVQQHLKGCVYRYVVGTKHYEQQFPCEFQLGGEAR